MDNLTVGLEIAEEMHQTIERLAHIEDRPVAKQYVRLLREALEARGFKVVPAVPSGSAAPPDAITPAITAPAAPALSKQPPDTPAHPAPTVDSDATDE
jgi:hypothetical protein